MGEPQNFHLAATGLPMCTIQGDHAIVERPAYTYLVITTRVFTVSATSVCYPTMKAGLYILPQLDAGREQGVTALRKPPSSVHGLTVNAMTLMTTKLSTMAQWVTPEPGPRPVHELVRTLGQLQAGVLPEGAVMRWSGLAYLPIYHIHG